MTIYDLTAHLKKCPPDFLRASNLQETDGVHTEALVADTYRKITGDYSTLQFDIPKAKTFQTCTSEHLIAVQIACWLLNHEYFSGGMDYLLNINRFLAEELATLSKYVKCPKWIEDDDRTEEMVRLALKCCNLLPDGETIAEAEDRFDSLSTIKRLGVLEKSNEAFERMKKIRRKMAEKKAREAANSYGRE